MDAYEDLALIVLVVLVMGAGLAATIIVFAGAGAASGYIAGRRAPSSTGRSGPSFWGPHYSLTDETCRH